MKCHYLYEMVKQYKKQNKKLFLIMGSEVSTIVEILEYRYYDNMAIVKDVKTKEIFRNIFASMLSKIECRTSRLNVELLYG